MNRNEHNYARLGKAFSYTREKVAQSRLEEYTVKRRKTNLKFRALR